MSKVLSSSLDLNVETEEVPTKLLIPSITQEPKDKPKKVLSWELFLPDGKVAAFGDTQDPYLASVNQEEVRILLLS